MIQKATDLILKWKQRTNIRENCMTTVAKVSWSCLKNTANKETHICVHNSINLVRSTKSWMYFTGSLGPLKKQNFKKKKKKRENLWIYYDIHAGLRFPKWSLHLNHLIFIDCLHKRKILILYGIRSDLLISAEKWKTCCSNKAERISSEPYRFKTRLK